MSSFISGELIQCVGFCWDLMMAQHAAGFAGHVHALRKLTKMLKRRLLGCLARPLRFCLERLVSVCSLQQQWSARPNQPTQVCGDQVCSFEQTSFAVQIVVLPHCGQAAEKDAPFSADRSLIARNALPALRGGPLPRSLFGHTGSCRVPFHYCPYFVYLVLLALFHLVVEVFFFNLV